MYKYKNYTYSLEEIQNAADKKNLSIDDAGELETFLIVGF